MYHATRPNNFYMIPTAEVPVTNIYRDVILDEKDFGKDDRLHPASAAKPVRTARTRARAEPPAPVH